MEMKILPFHFLLLLVENDNENGSTTLKYAARYIKASIFSLPLNRGLNLSVKDCSGSTIDNLKRQTQKMLSNSRCVAIRESIWPTIE